MIDGRPQRRETPEEIEAARQRTIEHYREIHIEQAAAFHGERCEARRLANRREA